jgi:hypothetical protein
MSTYMHGNDRLKHLIFWNGGSISPIFSFLMLPWTCLLHVDLSELLILKHVQNRRKGRLYHVNTKLSDGWLLTVCCYLEH